MTSTICKACLLPAGESYHRACLTEIFGADVVPGVDVELAALHTLGLAMVGRTSLSGVQRKLSLGLSADKLTLRVALAGAQYILKPQSETFPGLPENERLSMRILATLGLPTPPLALITLRDDTEAYVVKRFDRDGPRPAARGLLPTGGAASKRQVRRVCGTMCQAGPELRQRAGRGAAEPVHAAGRGMADR